MHIAIEYNYKFNITSTQKQKEELKRIYHMLDDLENDFMGSKDSNSSFIEKYMEVGNLVTVVTLVIP